MVLYPKWRRIFVPALLKCIICTSNINSLLSIIIFNFSLVRYTLRAAGSVQRAFIFVSTITFSPLFCAPVFKILTVAVLWCCLNCQCNCNSITHCCGKKIWTIRKAMESVLLLNKWIFFPIFVFTYRLKGLEPKYVSFSYCVIPKLMINPGVKCKISLMILPLQNFSTVPFNALCSVLEFKLEIHVFFFV